MHIAFWIALIVLANSVCSFAIEWPASANDVRDASWSSPGVSVDEAGPAGGGKRIILSKRPKGAFKDNDFKVLVEDIPEPKEDEVVVKNIYISIDPTHRIWASDEPQYMPCVQPGTCMRALTVSKVVKTSDSKLMPVGTYVTTFGGVQEYARLPIAGCYPVDSESPLTNNLSILSPIIGLTAWVGTNICEPKEGKTVVVSGAAGAVGSAAAQIAKNRGAKVICIAGSADKCKWLTEDLGLDGAINYKADDVGEKLDELCPEGVDAFFDNVGGPILHTVLTKMNNFGNIALCGLIDGYNSPKGLGVSLNNFQMLLMRRIKIQGFVCYDHLADTPTGNAEIAGYIKEGKLNFKEDIQEVDVEDYVKVVRKLYDGTNTGKLMMKISSE